MLGYLYKKYFIGIKKPGANCRLVFIEEEQLVFTGAVKPVAG
jgi:hypothetical protein